MAATRWFLPVGRGRGGPRHNVTRCRLWLLGAAILISAIGIAMPAAAAVPDAYEPDDSFGQATTIVVGAAAQQHTIDPEDDQDWVCFHVLAGLTYRVRSGDGITPNLTFTDLYDSNGTTDIGTYYRTVDAIAEYTADRDKAVYAQVMGFWAEAGDSYTISVEVISDQYEPDNSYVLAKPITVNGAAQQHNFFGDDEEDWVFFPVISGWKYIIETTRGDAPDGVDAFIALYDSDGTTRIGPPSADSGLQEYVATASKKLYARVSGRYGTYSLRVTAVPIARIDVTGSLDFGVITVGSSLQKTLTIRNTGTAPLVIGAVTFEGTGFTLAGGSPAGVTIPAGGSRDVAVRYTPSVAYSGAPSAVKKSWSNLNARYNYLNGQLYSISLYSGFQNVGGSGSLPWRVRIGSAEKTGSSNVVAGAKYTVETLQRVGTGTGLVELLQPVTATYDLRGYLGSVLGVYYHRVPEATLRIASNDPDEPTVFVGLYGTGTKRATALSLSAPATSTYMKAPLYGYLKYATSSGSMTPLKGRAVAVQQYVSGAWKTIATVTTSDTGKWTYTATPAKKATYRAVYAGDSTYLKQTSAKATVLPKVYLSTPTFRTSTTGSGRTALKYGTTYIVNGYLKPKHTSGSTQIKIKAYRWNGSTYVYKKTYTAIASNYSTYSRYNAKIKLPSKGTWRVRAYHAADTTNAKTYSSYRKVTVK